LFYGEEPYTLAITIKEAAGQKPFDAVILATDISTKVLRIAEAGIYSQEKIKNIVPSILKNIFRLEPAILKAITGLKKNSTA